MRRIGSLTVLLILLATACGSGETDLTTRTFPVSTTSPPAATKDSTTAAPAKTTSPASAETASGHPYRGTVAAAGPAAEFVTVLDSAVEAVDDEGVFSIRIDVTFEAIWVVGDDNNPPCVSTDHWVFAGSGPSAAELEIGLQMETLELLEISGCERDEEDEASADETLPFTGSLTNESVTGTFFEDLFVVTAERG